MTQVRLEVYKLTHRLRSYLGFAALVVLVGLVVLGIGLGGEMSFGSPVPAQFEMFGNYRNGGFAAWILLRLTTTFLLPLFACVVVGDMISGEAADGTLRAVLSRPIGRGQLYGGKFAVSAIYVLALTLFLGIAAYAIGSIFLGHGALVTFQEGSSFGESGVFIYPEGEGVLRLLGAYGFASLAVLSVAAIAFFISVIVTNSLGAIGGAMMAFIISEIVEAIPYFEPIHPFLLTTHMDAMGGAFVAPVPWLEMGRSAAVLAAYVVAFGIAGFAIFRRKDVLS